MSLLIVERSNPNKVTKRMDGWNEIFSSNLIIETVNKRLDERYKDIFAASPYKTGYLRSTIKKTSGEGFSQISVGAYYAIYVDQGRSPKGKRIPNPFWSNHIAGLTMMLIVDVRDLFASNW